MKNFFYEKISSTKNLMIFNLNLMKKIPRLNLMKRAKKITLTKILENFSQQKI